MANFWENDPVASKGDWYSNDPIETEVKSKDYKWSEVPGAALRNLPSSAGQFISGLAHTVAHPIQTAEDTFRLMRGMGSELQDIYQQKLGTQPLPPVEDEKSSEAFRKYLKNRYGSMEGFKRSLAEDPVGVLAEVGQVAAPFVKLPEVPIPAPEVPIPARAPSVAPLSETAQALERLKQAGAPIDVPRAVTSASPTVRAGGQALSTFPIVGTPLREAVHAVPEQIGGAVEDIARQYGRAAPENVGGRVGETIAARAEQEQEAAQAAARAVHEQAVADWERANQERVGAIQAQEAEVTHAAQRQFGDLHPTQMAEQTIADVQRAHQASDAANQANWEAVNRLNAPVSQQALEGLSEGVEQGVGRAGVTLGAETTPNALRMMAEVRRLTPEAPTPASGLHPRVIQALEREYGAGQVPDEAVIAAGGTPGTPGRPPDFRLMGEHAPNPGDEHVTAQGLNELRKRFVEMANDARTAQDRRASNAIKNQLNNWIADSFETHALGGDANANATIRQAVASHRAHMENFGYNAGNLPRGMHRSAAEELNQIATGNAGPTDTARKLIGAMPGGNEVSHPLYQRILNVVDNPGAVRDRLRGAYFRETNRGAPDVTANRIANLRESPMGRELFAPQELDQLHQYGRLRQQTELDIRRAKDVAGKRPVEAKIVPGEAQQLARQVLGRNRSEEKIFSTIDSMAREGGDVNGLGRVWSSIPEASRNEFRGAWLRNMGGGEDFNVNTFVKNWEDYTPKAKAVIFGTSGPHLQAMEDIYRVAKQYAETIRRYGNPSGTAQVRAWQQLAAGTIKQTAKVGAALAAGQFALGPFGTLAAGLGLRKLSKFLATPEGSQQVVRWNRLANAYSRAPSARTLYQLSNATRTLNQQ